MGTYFRFYIYICVCVCVCVCSFMYICKVFLIYQLSSVQLLSHVRLFVTPWTAARQAFLSFTISQSLLKLMSIEAVMPSNHLVLCLPFLLLPSIFPSIRVFSKESALCIPFLPSLKSAFHAEAGCFPPKHIYYCLNFLSLLA